MADKDAQILQVKVPGPIEIGIPDRRSGEVTQQTLTFADFVCETLLNHPRVWSQSTKRIRLSIWIEDQFRAVSPGDVVDLTREAHEALMEALDPNLWVLPQTPRELIRGGYWGAIEDAEEKSGAESEPLDTEAESNGKGKPRQRKRAAK